MGIQDISPGEKQLIGVARAVLRKSRIVALDEVQGAVGWPFRAMVNDLFARLNKGGNILYHPK